MIRSIPLPPRSLAFLSPLEENLSPRKEAGSGGYPVLRVNFSSPLHESEEMGITVPATTAHHGKNNNCLPFPGKLEPLKQDASIILSVLLTSLGNTGPTSPADQAQPFVWDHAAN